jgi:hypothetical protein
MRRVAWWLLALFAFAIPWEYSLDLGEPFGNVARIAGLLLLLAAVPALLQAGSLRRPDLLQWLVLASGPAAPISGPSIRSQPWSGCARISRS